MNQSQANILLVIFGLIFLGIVCKTKLIRLNLFAELDAIRERKKQIGIGYYFEKLGDRMRRAITVINEEDAKDTNEDSKK